MYILENVRTERDSMGEIAVSAERWWGAQTQRSVENFPIGTEKTPQAVIRAFALLKKAAATANERLNRLDPAAAAAIREVCDEILRGELDGEFPVSVWQTGSGTHTNMNVNEVIANRGNDKLGEKILHPNDTVNLGQSSNDTFPSAMHIAAARELTGSLIPELGELSSLLGSLSQEYGDVVKLGRTHLQDATPLTLGQEISGWETMLIESGTMIQGSTEYLLKLAIGGTAVGTGLNTHPKFGDLCAQILSEETGLPFVSAPNKFHALTSLDAMVYAHGALKALASNLMKIANDIRLLSSGPRGGLGELLIPENEPGSSIMPGKVNPTQCEAVTMIALRVMGNDATVGMAASQGNFELNVFLPVTADAFLQSVRLLADGMRSFRIRCVAGIRPNRERIRKNLENSLMLVTALAPKTGYDMAARVAKKAHEEGTTLREAALALGAVTEPEFDDLTDPAKMV